VSRLDAQLGAGPVEGDAGARALLDRLRSSL
jgi:hypothetical protein